ncbi:hypothetical protein [Clostridiisalibacter paucivorans]|uniref:hypothetical protein n=1 Tax=Clostridiisalibacter paucivorans TaxID=408753 RepID=UPI000A6287D6|nr:hypothetical protein [Clostridiisalibacter paucivorans]
MFGGIPVKEVDQLVEYWEAFPKLKDAIFEKTSDEYLSVKCDDIRTAIKSHVSLENYKRVFSNAFSDFYENLKNDLIEEILDVSPEHEKEKLSEDIFARIENVKIADKYKAYQILSDNWDVISTDLEMIQTEGFEVINQVDPNMIQKKKEANDDEVPEVQDGWKGHILPFELVQREILTEDFNEIHAIEKRLMEITSSYAEIIDSLDAEERDSSVLNDTNDAFVVKEVRSFVAEALSDVESDEINALKKYLELSKKKEKLDYINNCDVVKWHLIEQGADGTYKKGSARNRIMELQRSYEFPEDTFEYKIMTVLSLMEEEKQAKKDLKQKSEDLHIKTKETIENLDEDKSLYLLELKWIKPLVDSIFAIPDEIIEELISKVIHLYDKYSTTFSDIENQIENKSEILSNMFDELVGNTYDIEGLSELKKILGVE